MRQRYFTGPRRSASTDQGRGGGRVMRRSKRSL
jgi:hypothetical protein